MNIRKRLFTLCSLLCVSAALLVAAPTAERLYNDVEALDYQNQSLESIKKAYDNLDDGLSRDARQARKDMLEAREKGDLTAYLEAYERFEKLKTFRMKGEERNLLLGRIMAEAEPKRGEYASWLYQEAIPTARCLPRFSSQGDTYDTVTASRYRSRLFEVTPSGLYELPRTAVR